MKKLIAFATVLVYLTSCVAAQKPASPKMTAETDDISIVYGAPSKKERLIFGGLVPYNEVWRTGANEATEITLKKDAKVAGVPVKAGTYTLFTVPHKLGQDWTVILNPTLGQWGAFGYDKIKSKDLKHMFVASAHTDTVTEQMKFSFDGHNLVLNWDQTKVVLPIEI
ncbi:DUF2911 domain-containing protein [Marinilongibacter aquaticus]|uniref:DUF2911 domain-containing protein n=1 Tax=Marinilongibacter aquaticus TaxID=2975157 RepID=UPI0021BDA340|nr:DUF2911 domain-containing protein [Marinilongibacter aquaticus]UBM57360.1 DUF2911 domain-containing protein [Marinilongibacter aquaticus]